MEGLGDREIRDIASQIMVGDTLPHPPPHVTEAVAQWLDVGCVLQKPSPPNVQACVWQMLDVSMSQLSNLHPGLAAGITQKQSEVKDCWLLLQKVFR